MHVVTSKAIIKPRHLLAGNRSQLPSHQGAVSPSSRDPPAAPRLQHGARCLSGSPQVGSNKIFLLPPPPPPQHCPPHRRAPEWGRSPCLCCLRTPVSCASGRAPSTSSTSRMRAALLGGLPATQTGGWPPSWGSPRPLVPAPGAPLPGPMAGGASPAGAQGPAAGSSMPRAAPPGPAASPPPASGGD